MVSTFDGDTVQLASGVCENIGESTMDRRKFLIGMGATAAGSAAVLGSGAFTSVEAERDIDITVVGDGSAFLEIEAMDTSNGNEYVVNAGNGVVGLNFDSVNRNADSKFANLLRICNQGTQIVRVGVDDDESDLVDHGAGMFAEGPAGDGSLFPKHDVQPVGSDPGSGSASYNYGGSTAFDTHPNAEATGNGFDFDEDPVHLDVAECVEGIGLAWDRGNVDFDDLDDTHSIVIKAVALDGGQP